MTLKDKINMHLDLYANELSALIDETRMLHRKVCSKPLNYWSKNKLEYRSLIKQINSIESQKQALEQCKNDSITNL